MTGFYPAEQTILCDGLSLVSIAKAEGTPLYVYSAAAIRARYCEINDAFGSYPHAVHYALKANSTLGIVRLLRSLGSAVDANSGGEIEVALHAGFSPDQIVFTGVGKTSDELERAVALGVKAINVESPGELERLEAIARSQGARARVALRVNPDIDAESHPHISTGLSTHKFGTSIDSVRAICRSMSSRPALALVGIHVHVGSQIVTLEPLRRAAETLVSLACELRDHAQTIEHLDVGGGLGISYDGSPVPRPGEYASALLSVVRPSGLTILVEPGRAVVGPAGALVARVVDVKEQPGGKRFVVLDAGMSELVRPALYGAHHRIHLMEPKGRGEAVYDVVGPLCETSDMLGSARKLPLASVGDLVAVLDAGAYGSAMASNYNRHPLPAEVLVDAGAWRVIRRRQTVSDMLACEE